MILQNPVPVLRVFDESIAKKFYIDWLAFKLDWEHRSSPTAPLFSQVSRSHVILHLSEHWGDCSPGAKVMIQTDDIEALVSELQSRPISNLNPASNDAPWGGKMMRLIDPFGNQLVFHQPERK